MSASLRGAVKDVPTIGWLLLSLVGLSAPAPLAGQAGTVGTMVRQFQSGDPVKKLVVSGTVMAYLNGMASGAAVMASSLETVGALPEGSAQRLGSSLNRCFESMNSPQAGERMVTQWAALPELWDKPWNQQATESWLGLWVTCLTKEPQ